MKRTIAITFILGGTFVGFILGVVGWLVFYYGLMMAPRGTPFKYIDQGALPTIFTGPVGGFVGARVAGLIVSRFITKDDIKD